MTIGVTVLGSTGSIGVNTLDVIARHPDKFHICGLAAKNNLSALFEQCRQFEPIKVAMVDADAANQLEKKLIDAGGKTEVVYGENNISDLAEEFGGIVVCGIVGAAGLMSTISAVKFGKKVLIANKEPLVMLGDYIVKLAEDNNACLLPLDSEHNAIFQCLPQHLLRNKNGNGKITDDLAVRKILLTGSGGPFRQLPKEKLHLVSPDQACTHPNWQMGRKISVDSATMMNKGLELIEACVLFGISPNMIEIVIHPQSVIHSMVEYIDGSILAQMGSPDMRIPIASALAWPDRIASGANQLSLSEIARLDFETPDELRFPALRLAQIAAEKGGTLPAIMNAANEIAVEAFLNGQITFDKITDLVERTMEQVESLEVNDIDTVLEADLTARRGCMKSISKFEN